MADRQLLSVSVGQPKEITYVDRKGREKTTTTGIFKEPVEGRVMLRATNLDGDRQADLNGHGGTYKAAYVYSIENYRYWADELNRTDFASAAQFGENFTVSGMPDDEINVGDVFRIGGSVVEVSQPRVPCFKLGIRMGIPDFQKQFAERCRVGFYLRVIEEGEVGAGDAIECDREDPVRMSVQKMMRLLYFEPDNIEDAKRAVEITALSPGWRGSFEDRIAKAAGG